MTWVLQMKYEPLIKTVELKYVTKIAGVTNHDKLRNRDIRYSLRQQSFQDKIESEYKMNNNRLFKRVAEARQTKKKQRRERNYRDMQGLT